MARSKVLPWKVAPKADVLIEVGSPEYGVLEIPKKGVLTVNESEFIRQNTKHLPDIQQQALMLASEIAKEEGISFGEAFEALTNGVTLIPIVLTAPAKKGDKQLAIGALKRDVAKGATITLGETEILVTADAKLGDETISTETLPLSIEKDSQLAIALANGVAQKHAIRLMNFQRESVETTPLRNAVYASVMLRRIMGPDWTIEQTSEELPMQVINDLADFCSKEMNGWEEVTDEGGEPEPVTEETLKNV